VVTCVTCGTAPAIARRRCSRCYFAWYHATNPYKKRGRQDPARQIRAAIAQGR
jgi:hypothetical protein